MRSTENENKMQCNDVSVMVIRSWTWWMRPISFLLNKTYNFCLPKYIKSISFLICIQMSSICSASFFYELPLDKRDWKIKRSKLPVPCRKASPISGRTTRSPLSLPLSLSAAKASQNADEETQFKTTKYLQSSRNGWRWYQKIFCRGKNNRIQGARKRK